MEKSPRPPCSKKGKSPCVHHCLHCSQWFSTQLLLCPFYNSYTVPSRKSDSFKLPQYNSKVCLTMLWKRVLIMYACSSIIMAFVENEFDHLHLFVPLLFLICFILPRQQPTKTGQCQAKEDFYGFKNVKMSYL